VPPTLKLAAAVPSGVSALVIGITPGQAEDEGAVFDRGAIADLKAFGADPAVLHAVLSREKVKGKVGDITALPIESRLVFAVGLGDRTPRDYRRAGAAIARRLKSVDTAAVTVARRSPPAQVRALAEGLLLGGYSFKVTNTPKPEVLKSVSLVVERSDARADALREGVLTASAALVARDLANTPSSTKTPAWLGK
jgi:leucyl aminopeptidase